MLFPPPSSCLPKISQSSEDSMTPSRTSLHLLISASSSRRCLWTPTRTVTSKNSFPAWSQNAVAWLQSSTRATSTVLEALTIQTRWWRSVKDSTSWKKPKTSGRTSQICASAERMRQQYLWLQTRFTYLEDLLTVSRHWTLSSNTRLLLTAGTQFK